MKSNKMRKFSCAMLLAASFGCVFSQVNNFLSLNGKVYASNSEVKVSKINDNTAKLSYINNDKNTDIVIIKENCNKGYLYKILNADTKKELSTFCTEKEINFDVSDKSNSQINTKINAAAVAIVTAIMNGEDPWGAVAAALGSAYAVLAEGTVPAIISLIAESGMSSIPAVIGLLSASEGIIALIGVAGVA